MKSWHKVEIVGFSTLILSFVALAQLKTPVAAQILIPTALAGFTRGFTKAALKDVQGSDRD